MAEEASGAWPLKEMAAGAAPRCRAVVTQRSAVAVRPGGWRQPVPAPLMLGG